MPAAERTEDPRPPGELKAELLEEASRIGDELLEKAERGPSGMSWKSLELLPDSSVDWRTTESLYSGVAGIALFFLELHRQTQRAEYLEAATEGMRWVESFCEENPTDNYSFFSGRMGVSWALLQTHRQTRENRYLQGALSAASDCGRFLRKKRRVNDLLNGTSGTLLGLLHLHAETGEAWILEQIEQCVENLIAEMHLGPTGIYWDRSGNQIRGLCGLSHGASGVGLALLEAGHYLRRESLCWLAEQAFRYEDHFFDRGRNNWPDFRKGLERPEEREKHRKAYLRGDLSFFNRPWDMNAWCHGAAGIGISRLRAYELLRRSRYKESVESAIAKTKQTELDSPTPEPRFPLCHGGCGSAQLFLSAYRSSGDEEHRRLAEEVARRALQRFRLEGRYRSGLFPHTPLEDTSLFMGNAGIGYFYLELADPAGSISPLVPFLRRPASFSRPSKPRTRRQSPLSLPNIRKRVLERAFPRCLSLLGELEPAGTAALLCCSGSGAEDPVADFLRGLADVVERLPEGPRMRVGDAARLETAKHALGDPACGNAWLEIKGFCQREAGKSLSELPDGELRWRQLQTDPDATIIICSWDWSGKSAAEHNSNLLTKPGEFPILLRPLPTGVAEARLSPLAYVLLETFRVSRQLGYTIQRMISAFEPESRDDSETIEKTLFSQVREALTSGLLVETNPNPFPG